MDARPAVSLTLGGSSAAPAPSPGFEGVEKVVEIDFAPGHGSARGLREIPRAAWDEILSDARCTILNSLSSDTLDSYVLSESSLFVYPLKLVIKTCGTTTLLMALPRLLQITQSLNMCVEWFSYTRKDFLFPAEQKFPHRGASEEIAYLKDLFPEGSAFIMGPVTADHWFMYVADYVDRPTTECVDRTLDMMMFGIDEEVAKFFIKNTSRFPTDADVTQASGIGSLLPGSAIQEFCFEPCGYSMNGLLFDAYWTIHITPESHCSYASFETNVRMREYAPLVKAVLGIFRPKRFTQTLFADDHGLLELHGGASAAFPMCVTTLARAADAPPVSPVALVDGHAVLSSGSSAPPLSPRTAAANTLSYVQAHKSSSTFMGYSSLMANYVLVHAGETGDAPESIAAAATKTLGMPRAKHILPESLAKAASRSRLSSFNA